MTARYTHSMPFGAETRDHGHVDAILTKLHEAGYPAELMDDVS